MDALMFLFSVVLVLCIGFLLWMNTKAEKNGSPICNKDFVVSRFKKNVS